MLQVQQAPITDTKITPTAKDCHGIHVHIGFLVNVVGSIQALQLQYKLITQNENHSAESNVNTYQRM